MLFAFEPPSLPLYAQPNLLDPLHVLLNLRFNQLLRFSVLMFGGGLSFVGEFPNLIGTLGILGFVLACGGGGGAAF